MLIQKVCIQRSIYQHYIFFSQLFGCQQIFRLHYYCVLRAVGLPHIPRLDVKAFEAAENIVLLRLSQSGLLGERFFYCVLHSLADKLTQLGMLARALHIQLAFTVGNDNRLVCT